MSPSLQKLVADAYLTLVAQQSELANSLNRFLLLVWNKYWMHSSPTSEIARRAGQDAQYAWLGIDTQSRLARP